MRNFNENNIILSADSYKYSQFNQYPPGTEYVYSYVESRGGRYDETVFFGLQMFVKKYLTRQITQDDIDQAAELMELHGEPFNRAGWQYILEKHNGRLPVRIRALPEGTVIGTKKVLLTIVNTDPECFWLTSFLETAILKAIWYPTTVATNSREIKKLIKRFLEDTGDVAGLDFKLHDFGFRGVSSKESAGIGGAAHLVNFLGTDTVMGLVYARNFYGSKIAGFSIPAMEHSTVTSWGRDNEAESYRNMLRQNGKPGGLVACVSDAWDIYKACEMWGTTLKQDVLDSGAIVVIRPDSGDPTQVVLDCVRILDKNWGSTVNSKGYKVLNTVRVIQGDGINYSEINSILTTLRMNGYSADNVAFGMGGALLQGVTRDDQKFAMKCSAVRINGVWTDVYKDPVTDPGKVSKKGLVTTTFVDGKFETAIIERIDRPNDSMETYFCDGAVFYECDFDEVRQRAAV